MSRIVLCIAGTLEGIVMDIRRRVHSVIIRMASGVLMMITQIKIN